MNLLAIETTTSICSVALAQNARRDALGMSQSDCIEHSRFAPRAHNEHALAMIDIALKAVGIAHEDLDCIAFGAGPGSFTGVRIGAAIAQGIGFAADAKVIPVPSSAVAAETLRTASKRRGEVRISRQSRPGWHYVARYRLTDQESRCIEFDTLRRVADDAAVLSADRLAVSARTVAALALERLAEAVEPALALPCYVDGDSPWRPAD